MTNKEKIKHFYEVIVSENNLKQYHEFISENCKVRINETVLPIGLKGMEEHAVAVRGTYPDLKMFITNQYADGEYIISEFLMEGTHVGEWLEMKPTNKKLKFFGVNIDKLENGKIIEHSGYMNTFETLFENNIISPT